MTSSKIYSSDTLKEDDNAIDLKKILQKLLEKWPWFILSIILCLIAAFLYIKNASPIYSVNARVLVNSDKDSGGLPAKAGAGVSDLGSLLGGKSSADNEVEVLKTRFIMEQVVRKMQLNIVYNRISGFKTTEMYKAPFKLQLLKGIDTIKPTEITLNKLPGNQINIKYKDVKKTVKWGEKVTIKSLGVVQFLPESDETMEEGEYSVMVTSIDDKVSELMSRLNVALSNKQVTIIDLDLTYPVPRKGEEILATLIHQYIVTNIDDRNEVADSTIKFIHNRLSYIGGELGGLEGNIQTFRQKNQLADMTTQSKILVENSGQYVNDLAKAEVQISILSELERYLKDDTKNKRVLPSSLIPNDMVFSNAMDRYNNLLIERDRQLLSVTEESPFIQNIDKQIANLRKDILGNLQSSTNSYIVSRDKLRNQIKQADSKIQQVPETEKNYLVLARQQKIKEQLYIFLMEKAEETAISKSSNVAVAKTIDPPKANNKPVSPKKLIILIISLIAGFVIPLVIIFIKEILDDKISSKDDIVTQTNIPIIGEIRHNVTTDNMVVASNGRSAISEQFRALRTNLSFYLKEENQKVILFTSSISGEGKSFTAINLGNIFALTGKRVLLMEMDLRKPGLSSKLKIDNNKGLSNYAIDPKLTAADIILPLEISKNIFLISSGPIPPNPAEILMSDRIDQLLTEVKQQFDYIIMDAPPIGIITDAQLIAAHANISIYMMRQGVTLKEHVKIANDLYINKKLKNLTIVVNDIKSKGYGTGYGYGSYGEEQTDTFLDKLKNIFKKS